MATGTIKQVMNNSGLDYCKMPDGTLIQWGKQTLNMSDEMTLIGTSGIYKTPVFYISFPIDFANTNYVVYGMSRYSTGHIVSLGAVPSLKGQFIAMAYDFNKRSLNDGQFLIRWQAVGRWK